MHVPTLIGAVLLCSIAVPAAAQSMVADEVHGGSDRLDSLTPLPAAELAEARGGFRFNGLNITLGADMRTFINGELALHTVVSWTDTGVSTVQTVSGALTPAAADQLRAGVLVSGDISFRVGDSAVFVANEGRTALMHRTDGGLQNVLVNTASGVDLRQEVDAQLDLGGYAGFASDLMAMRLGAIAGAAIAQMTPTR